MSDFLLKHYLLITHLVEAFAALTGAILYKKYRFTTVKFFILFLVYLTVCDTLNLYVRFAYPDKFLSFLIGTVFISNYWWSTLFWKIGAIMFFAFYYRKILKNKLFKKVIKVSSYCFLGFSIIYIAINWDDFFIRFFPIISVLGAVIVFLCTVFYFVEILQSDKILTFYKSLNFYITVAIFIWWLIITPVVFYDIYNTNLDKNYINLRRHIYLFANIFMYLTYTFALIWCKPETK